MTKVLKGRSNLGHFEKSTQKEDLILAILSEVLTGRSNLGNFDKSTRKEDLILATCSKSAIRTLSASCGKDDIGGQNIPTVVQFWQNWFSRSKSDLFHRKEDLRKVTHEFLIKNCYSLPRCRKLLSSGQ